MQQLLTDTPGVLLFASLLNPLNGSSLFSVGTFSLAQDGPGSHPQMTQIITDVFMSFTHLLNLCREICGT
jgi:hypothetical protein